MEVKVIHHFCHEHPLILTKNMDNKKRLCYGCKSPVISESAYVCIQQYYCSSSATSILHQRCAELPTQILHPSHPQHPIRLFDHQERYYTCSLCDGVFHSVLRYRCPSCHFNIDIKCEKLGISGSLEERKLQHLSHHHPLTLMRKPPSLFCCDGCGTEDRDMAYICSECDFWIHKTCASLPITLRANHHHHDLYLAFCFPFEHRKFKYNCRVCNTECSAACWVYYCGAGCKYFAHVKCATSTEATKRINAAQSSNLNTEDNDSADLIQLPAHDFSKELITPFVIRENGFDRIPDMKDIPASITMPGTTASFSVLFNYHKHPLSLVLKGSTSDELMICDMCVTPIYSPPYYYCATCKYFVHSTCYFLPKALSCPVSQLCLECIPAHENHKLTAYSGSELDNKGWLLCDLCQFPTNGMVYQCEVCKKMIDVKCMSLPTTIKHASHPQHKLIKRRIPKEERGRRCGCGFRFKYHRSLVAYYCTSYECDFALHLSCGLLPLSVKDERDKHLLLLMYDASIDYPADFYCEVCETEMNPSKWMYHCRECDSSFDYDCLRTSGVHRNIKFGRQFEFDHSLHPHPLTYSLISLELGCDICHDQDWYQEAGFECALCNYVVCHVCGLKELDKM